MPPEPSPANSELAVLESLRQVVPGIHSVWDVVNGTTPETAIPILAKWFPQVSDVRLKEGLVRALSVPSAGADVARCLVAEFRQAEDDNLRWTVGNALECVRSPAVGSDLVELLREPRYGNARQMIAVALGLRCYHDVPDADDALIEALSDPGLVGHAAKALADRRTVRAIPALRATTSCETSFHRRRVARAIERLTAVGRLPDK